MHGCTLCPQDSSGSKMSISVEEFLAELEVEYTCSRKAPLPVDARRLISETDGLFELITGYISNLRAETDTYSGVGGQSRGWACGAFREAQRIIDLTVEAFCAGWGLHVPRDRSAGVRKSIAAFLLSASPSQEPGAIGELGCNLRNSTGTQSIRRGRHALSGSQVPHITTADLLWLRRRVKYPEARIQDDDLQIEMERALYLARRVHTNLINMFED